MSESEESWYTPYIEPWIKFKKKKEEKQMTKLTSNVFKQSEHTLTNATPTKIPIKRVKTDDRQVLWVLGAESRGIGTLEDYTGVEREELEKSLKRLIAKKWVEKEKETYHLTTRGKNALIYLIHKGKIWPVKRPPPIVNSRFKVVAFDLDDTLIPGYVTKNVPVSTMRDMLETLKRNKIKVAVLSVNSTGTVLDRLRNYGLEEYIDYPVFTNKAQGISVIEKTMGIKPEEILMIGHDWSLDWLGVKRTHPNVEVAMLRDAISSSDSKTSKLPEGVLYMNRDMTDFLKVLRGELKESEDKAALLKKVDYYAPANTFSSDTGYKEIANEDLKTMVAEIVMTGESKIKLSDKSDLSLGKLRFLLEEVMKTTTNENDKKHVEKQLITLNSWKITSVQPFFEKKPSSLPVFPSAFPTASSPLYPPLFPGEITYKGQPVEVFTTKPPPATAANKGLVVGDRITFTTAKGKVVTGPITQFADAQNVLVTDALTGNGYSLPIDRIKKVGK